MISLIVCGTLFLLGIIVAYVSANKYCDNDRVGLGAAITIVSFTIGLASILYGYCVFDKANCVIEKQQIEIGLKTDAYLLFIDAAYKHNREINVGNNYWCRFTIEDREDFKIDIDNYIKIERV